jgi:polyisoprenoid-binding protein YceI
MFSRPSIRLLIGSIAIAGVALGATGRGESPLAPLAIDSARVTIAGTSNVHPYVASTMKVSVTRVRLGAVAPGATFWEGTLKPGAIEAFDITIPALSLTSPKGDIDKNMYKALKADEHPDITFRLARFEARDGTPGTGQAVGMLTIAGVEREVALQISTKRTGATLAVQGHCDLLMTDYGITPPKAMLGMLKTDPKVSVTFETVLKIPVS